MDILSPDELMEEKKKGMEEEIEALTEKCMQQLMMQFHEVSFPSVYIDVEGFDAVVIDEVINKFKVKKWNIKKLPDNITVKQLQFKKLSTDEKYCVK